MVDPKVMMIGNDHYTDRYGAALAKQLTPVLGPKALLGVGGRFMEEAGVTILRDMSCLDSLGVLDSLRGAHLAKRVVQRLNEAMDQVRPDLLIQIGAPVFQNRLLQLAKCKGIPVVYYCTTPNPDSSGVKLSELRDLVNKVAVVTRKELLRVQEAGMDGVFVGHPLRDLAIRQYAKAEARQRLGLSLSDPVLTLLPGTRDFEVKALLPTMLKGVERVKKEIPSLAVLASFDAGINPVIVHSWKKQMQHLGLEIVADPYRALEPADLAVVNCGSVSLEATLLGVPAIAVHKVSKTTYLKDKGLLRKEHSALANVLLRDGLLPELVQNQFTESNLSEAIQRLLHSPSEAYWKEYGGGFDEELGGKGTISEMASLVLSLLEGARVSLRGT